MSDAIRIVVVDDYADLAEAFAAALDLDGYEVAIAFDGDTALELVVAFEPHAVILDINMPGMSGVVLAETLRRRHRDGVVLIAVTGYGRGALGVTETSNCFDHYLQKPVDFDQLRSVLGACTNRSVHAGIFDQVADAKNSCE